MYTEPATRSACWAFILECVWSAFRERPGSFVKLFQLLSHKIIIKYIVSFPSGAFYLWSGACSLLVHTCSPSQHLGCAQHGYWCLTTSIFRKRGAWETIPAHRGRVWWLRIQREWLQHLCQQQYRSGPLPSWHQTSKVSRADSRSMFTVSSLQSYTAWARHQCCFNDPWQAILKQCVLNNDFVLNDELI